MEKIRYKITINWYGENHQYYRHASTQMQALRFAIRKLAREVGYSTRYVRKYVMDDSCRRWETKVN